MINLDLCRICGWDLGEHGWEQVDAAPNYIICPCCAAESGVDDITQRMRRRYRQEWIERGCPWFDPGEKPEGWRPEGQLALATLLSP